MSQQEIPQICEASKLSHQECTHYAVVPSGFSPHIVFFRWRCNFISISSIVNSSVPSTQCGSPILIGWIWHLLAHIHKSFCWFLFGPFLEPFCLWWADMKTCLSDWCGVGVVTARTSTLLRCEKKIPHQNDSWSFHLASSYYLLMIQGSFTHISCFWVLSTITAPGSSPLNLGHAPWPNNLSRFCNVR